ncbi:TetR/AcrR family transcriptional regulator [Actinomycetospora termitidis]|uniref:TetR/AcrR family transcriptional regulator C-terminal domain-containing protein n=1 Tax=Actinomycetospora termitidis TaxID=3053470 RepID=A0ABT7MGL7_9PSEU|nr:TetR/AcrR family transcriptional regulator C-terminal domain-containing protein [Actinomycetospora sp. Odt1-22]MDL5159087.1 TetR/AcrR family transcriptional regulator C-terminal domain-containing protein [Actinomycetospora sp. Odt1-22]
MTMGDQVFWLRDEPARATRRATPLTRERIVESAVAELDEHGAERLTMRRLAQRLEVTSTALYWHVATKEDLLDLALDRAVGEVALPDADDEPRAAIRALMHGWRVALLAHPWAPVLLGRPTLGPNVLARTEFLQAMLTRAGLSGVELASAARLLSTHVLGSAMQEVSWRRVDDPALLEKAREHITRRADLYPTLNSSGFLDAGRHSPDDLFSLGLDRLLTAVLGPASPPRRS